MFRSLSSTRVQKFPRCVGQAKVYSKAFITLGSIATMMDARRWEGLALLGLFSQTHGIHRLSTHLVTHGDSATIEGGNLRPLMNISQDPCMSEVFLENANSREHHCNYEGTNLLLHWT